MMDKILEDYLWSQIDSPSNPDAWNSQYHRSPKEVIDEMLSKGWIKSPKQAWRTLEKWTSKRIYDYGSRLDLGWKVKK